MKRRYTILRNESRSRRIARLVFTSDAGIALAAEAAQLGVWELDVATNKVWLSDKVREIFAIEPEVLTYYAFQ